MDIYVAVRSGQPMARIRFRDAASAEKMVRHALQPIAGALPAHCEWQPTSRPPQDTGDAPGAVLLSTAACPMQLGWLAGRFQPNKALHCTNLEIWRMFFKGPPAL